jgi:hypothetical protein
MNISDQITWYSERHLLHIDLSSLINTPITLILTSWNHPCGVTWALHNAVEQIDELYDDPFRAPYFPIWECLTDDKACDEYLNQIPKAIAVTLRLYRSVNFGMLMMLSQNKNLINFSEKYSTLFWLLFRQAKNDHWSKIEFLDVCNQGESAMLIACGLPANDIALEAIAKFTANNFAQLQSDYIHRLFTELDYQHLNANLEHIPDHLIQFLLRYPELQHAKLIQSLNRADHNELLRIVRNLRAVATQIDSVNLELLIAESDNIPALKSHYKRLEALALQKALQDYDKQLKSAEVSSRSLPQLSLFVDRDDLVQILSEVDLLADSWLCRQNLMRYVPGILSEHYAVYRMLKPQRATAVYYLFPEQDGGIRPVLKCQYCRSFH